jgi:hypothetical protein
MLRFLNSRILFQKVGSRHFSALLSFVSFVSPLTDAFFIPSLQAAKISKGIKGADKDAAAQAIEVTREQKRVSAFH